MKFDFVIGNPPFQDETLGDNTTYAPPVYHLFMDATQSIGKAVALITPARFLFNAGSTPKQWNQKMLNDEHLKISYYEQKSNKVFVNTDIKGGVCISYYDRNKNFGAIEIFTPFEELNNILHKVINRSDYVSFSKIIITSYAYHFLPIMYEEYPNLKGKLSEGHDFDLKSNCFEKLKTVFYDTEPDDNDEYLKILGRMDNKRVYRYIKSKYVNKVDNLYYYKAFMSGATGTGVFGETVVPPIIGYPKEGSTETFLSIGKFSTEFEANAVIKYVKCKFTRTLYSILKRTQANTPAKWKYVPLQDFTENSDIDWTKSVVEIDRQLYAKYGLTDEEIFFIETNVKEMK